MIIKYPSPSIGFLLQILFVLVGLPWMIRSLQLGGITKIIPWIQQRNPLIRRNEVSINADKIGEDYYIFNEKEKDPSLQQLVVRFNCIDIDSDEISELLHEMGTLSVSVEVESERPDVVNEEANWEDLVKTSSWATAILRATVPSTFDIDTLSLILQESYPSENFDINVEKVVDRDWVSHVQQLWNPQEIGQLTICLPWHDVNMLSADKIAVGQNNHRFLTLEGGAAFGTGDHPTTRLCCAWIQEVVRSTSNAKVLDYGCGSAVLGLTALLFGAQSADGVDIDKDALASAARNANKNELDLSFYIADDTDSPKNDYQNMHENEVNSILMNTMRGNEIQFPSVSSISNVQYDIVVANILAPILLALAKTLSDHTAPNGQIALSGILKSQAPTVINKYKSYFPNIAVVGEESDWVLITGRKYA